METEREQERGKASDGKQKESAAAGKKKAAQEKGETSEYLVRQH